MTRKPLLYATPSRAAQAAGTPFHKAPLAPQAPPPAAATTSSTAPHGSASTPPSFASSRGKAERIRGGASGPRGAGNPRTPLSSTLAPQRLKANGEKSRVAVSSSPGKRMKKNAPIPPSSIPPTNTAPPATDGVPSSLPPAAAGFHISSSSSTSANTDLQQEKLEKGRGRGGNPHHFSHKSRSTSSNNHNYPDRLAGTDRGVVHQKGENGSPPPTHDGDGSGKSTSRSTSRYSTRSSSSNRMRMKERNAKGTGRVGSVIASASTPSFSPPKRNSHTTIPALPRETEDHRQKMEILRKSSHYRNHHAQGATSLRSRSPSATSASPSFLQRSSSSASLKKAAPRRNHAVIPPPSPPLPPHHPSPPLANSPLPASASASSKYSSEPLRSPHGNRSALEKIDGRSKRYHQPLHHHESHTLSNHQSSRRPSKDGGKASEQEGAIKRKHSSNNLPTWASSSSPLPGPAVDHPGTAASAPPPAVIPAATTPASSSSPGTHHSHRSTHPHQKQKQPEEKNASRRSSATGGTWMSSGGGGGGEKMTKVGPNAQNGNPSGRRGGSPPPPPPPPSTNTRSNNTSSTSAATSGNTSMKSDPNYHSTCTMAPVREEEAREEGVGGARQSSKERIQHTVEAEGKNSSSSTTTTTTTSTTRIVTRRRSSTSVSDGCAAAAAATTAEAVLLLSSSTTLASTTASSSSSPAGTGSTSSSTTIRTTPTSSSACSNSSTSSSPSNHHTGKDRKEKDGQESGMKSAGTVPAQGAVVPRPEKVHRCSFSENTEKKQRSVGKEKCAHKKERGKKKQGKKKEEEVVVVMEEIHAAYGVHSPCSCSPLSSRSHDEVDEHHYCHGPIPPYHHPHHHCCRDPHSVPLHRCLHPLPPYYPPSPPHHHHPCCTAPSSSPYYGRFDEYYYCYDDYPHPPFHRLPPSQLHRRGEEDAGKRRDHPKTEPMPQSRKSSSTSTTTTTTGLYSSSPEETKTNHCVAKREQGSRKKKKQGKDGEVAMGGDRGEGTEREGREEMDSHPTNDQNNKKNTIVMELGDLKKNMLKSLPSLLSSETTAREISSRRSSTKGIEKEKKKKKKLKGETKGKERPGGGARYSCSSSSLSCSSTSQGPPPAPPPSRLRPRHLLHQKQHHAHPSSSSRPSAATFSSFSSNSMPLPAFQNASCGSQQQQQRQQRKKRQNGSKKRNGSTTSTTMIPQEPHCHHLNRDRQVMRGNNEERGPNRRNSNSRNISTRRRHNSTSVTSCRSGNTSIHSNSSCRSSSKLTNEGKTGVEKKRKTTTTRDKRSKNHNNARRKASRSHSSCSEWPSFAWGSSEAERNGKRIEEKRGTFSTKDYPSHSVPLPPLPPASRSAASDHHPYYRSTNTASRFNETPSHHPSSPRESTQQREKGREGKGINGIGTISNKKEIKNHENPSPPSYNSHNNSSTHNSRSCRMRNQTRDGKWRFPPQGSSDFAIHQTFSRRHTKMKRESATSGHHGHPDPIGDEEEDHRGGGGGDSQINHRRRSSSRKRLEDYSFPLSPRGQGDGNQDKDGNSTTTTTKKYRDHQSSHPFPRMSESDLTTSRGMERAAVESNGKQQRGLRRRSKKKMGVRSSSARMSVTGRRRSGPKNTMGSTEAALRARRSSDGKERSGSRRNRRSTSELSEKEKRILLWQEETSVATAGGRKGDGPPPPLPLPPSPSLLFRGSFSSTYGSLLPPRKPGVRRNTSNRATVGSPSSTDASRIGEESGSVNGKKYTSKKRLSSSWPPEDGKKKKKMEHLDTQSSSNRRRSSGSSGKGGGRSKRRSMSSSSNTRDGNDPVRRTSRRPSSNNNDHKRRRRSSDSSVNIRKEQTRKGWRSSSSRPSGSKRKRCDSLLPAAEKAGRAPLPLSSSSSSANIPRRVREVFQEVILRRPAENSLECSEPGLDPYHSHLLSLLLQEGGGAGQGSKRRCSSSFSSTTSGKQKRTNKKAEKGKRPEQRKSLGGGGTKEVDGRSGKSEGAIGVMRDGKRNSSAGKIGEREKKNAKDMLMDLLGEERRQAQKLLEKLLQEQEEERIRLQQLLRDEEEEGERRRLLLQQQEAEIVRWRNLLAQEELQAERRRHLLDLHEEREAKWKALQSPPPSFTEKKKKKTSNNKKKKKKKKIIIMTNNIACDAVGCDHCLDGGELHSSSSTSCSCCGDCCPCSSSTSSSSTTCCFCSNTISSSNITSSRTSSKCSSSSSSDGKAPTCKGNKQKQIWRNGSIEAVVQPPNASKSRKRSKKKNQERRPSLSLHVENPSLLPLSTPSGKNNQDPGEDVSTPPLHSGNQQKKNTQQEQEEKKKKKMKKKKKGAKVKSGGEGGQAEPSQKEPDDHQDYDEGVHGGVPHTLHEESIKQIENVVKSLFAASPIFGLDGGGGGAPRVCCPSPAPPLPPHDNLGAAIATTNTTFSTVLEERLPCPDISLPSCEKKAISVSSFPASSRPHTPHPEEVGPPPLSTHQLAGPSSACSTSPPPPPPPPSFLPPSSTVSESSSSGVSSPLYSTLLLPTATSATTVVPPPPLLTPSSVPPSDQCSSPRRHRSSTSGSARRRRRAHEHRRRPHHRHSYNRKASPSAPILRTSAARRKSSTSTASTSRRSSSSRGTRRVKVAKQNAHHQGSSSTPSTRSPSAHPCPAPHPTSKRSKRNTTTATDEPSCPDTRRSGTSIQFSEKRRSLGSKGSSSSSSRSASSSSTPAPGSEQGLSFSGDPMRHRTRHSSSTKSSVCGGGGHPPHHPGTTTLTGRTGAPVAGAATEDPRLIPPPLTSPCGTATGSRSGATGRSKRRRNTRMLLFSPSMQPPIQTSLSSSSSTLLSVGEEHCVCTEGQLVNQLLAEGYEQHARALASSGIAPDALPPPPAPPPPLPPPTTTVVTTRTASVGGCSGSHHCPHRNSAEIGNACSCTPEVAFTGLEKKTKKAKRKRREPPPHPPPPEQGKEEVAAGRESCVSSRSYHVRRLLSSHSSTCVPRRSRRPPPPPPCGYSCSSPPSFHVYSTQEARGSPPLHSGVHHHPRSGSCCTSSGDVNPGTTVVVASGTTKFPSTSFPMNYFDNGSEPPPPHYLHYREGGESGGEEEVGVEEVNEDCHHGRNQSNGWEREKSGMRASPVKHRVEQYSPNPRTRGGRTFHRNNGDVSCTCLRTRRRTGCASWGNDHTTKQDTEREEENAGRVEVERRPTMPTPCLRTMETSIVSSKFPISWEYGGGGSDDADGCHPECKEYLPALTSLPSPLSSSPHFTREHQGEEEEGERLYFPFEYPPTPPPPLDAAAAPHPNLCDSYDHCSRMMTCQARQPTPCLPGESILLLHPKSSGGASSFPSSVIEAEEEECPDPASSCSSFSSFTIETDAKKRRRCMSANKNVTSRVNDDSTCIVRSSAPYILPRPRQRSSSPSPLHGHSPSHFPYCRRGGSSRDKNTRRRTTSSCSSRTALLQGSSHAPGASPQEKITYPSIPFPHIPPCSCTSPPSQLFCRRCCCCCRGSSSSGSDDKDAHHGSPSSPQPHSSSSTISPCPCSFPSPGRPSFPHLPLRSAGSHHPEEERENQEENLPSVDAAATQVKVPEIWKTSHAEDHCGLPTPPPPPPPPALPPLIEYSKIWKNLQERIRKGAPGILRHRRDQKRKMSRLPYTWETKARVPHRAPKEAEEQEKCARSCLEEEEQREMNEFIRYKQWMHTEIQRYREKMHDKEAEKKREKEKKRQKSKEKEEEEKRSKEKKQHDGKLEKDRRQIEQWENEMRYAVCHYGDWGVPPSSQGGVVQPPSLIQEASPPSQRVTADRGGGETQGEEEEITSSAMLQAEALRLSTKANKLKAAERKQRKLAEKLVRAAAKREREELSKAAMLEAAKKMQGEQLLREQQLLEEREQVEQQRLAEESLALNSFVRKGEDPLVDLPSTLT